VDGMLVPTGDVDAIAAALLRLMNDRDLRVKMGAAALENARRYDPVLIAERYEKLFEEHLTDSGSRRRTLASSARKLRSGSRALFRVLPGLKIRSGSSANPIALVRVDDGNVIVQIPGDLLPRDMSRLVCRPRRIEGVRKAVKVPLTGSTATGWTASFPAESGPFAEGRWDLYAEDRRKGLHRLRAGLLDVRNLIGGGDSLPFVRNIPYPTADGFLAIGTWHRDEHAEAGQIWYGDETITVTGRLLGDDFGTTVPTLKLNRRGEYPDTLTVPGTTSGNGEFTFDVPLAQLAALRLLRYEDWDAAVSRGPDGPPVTIARLMDEVIERKRVYVYPSVLLTDAPSIDLYEESPKPELRIWPYFSIQGNLTLVVSDRPA
jgi:hypothetical protein